MRRCRRCGVAGGERVPPAPLGWYFKLILAQTLNPGCRGSSHFSPLDAVLDPVYRPGIAPDTLKDLSCPSPLAPDTLDSSPHSSPLAPAFNTSPAPDANLLFFLRQLRADTAFPNSKPNRRTAAFVFNNNHHKG